MASLHINSASVNNGVSKFLAMKEGKSVNWSSININHAQIRWCRGARVGRLAWSNPESRAIAITADTEASPQINFVFVSPKKLEDGSLEVQRGPASGGQKLRDIMLDNNLDLYGPYKLPLFNCGGGGTCGTCLVEILQGQELFNERTSIEKEKLKKKPKTWRLACQTVVGDKDSVGKESKQGAS